MGRVSHQGGASDRPGEADGGQAWRPLSQAGPLVTAHVAIFSQLQKVKIFILYYFLNV